MKVKEFKIDQVTGEHIVEPCVKGNEMLSPRDLAAYLRLRNGADEGEAGELPPEVKEHLDACAICRENWNFLEKTDPILRASRKERLRLIIRSVKSAEEAERTRLAAVKEYGDMQAAAAPSLSPEDQSELIAPFRAALSEANSDLIKEARSMASQLPSNEPLALGKKISGISAKVAAITNKDERVATTKRVCGMFGDVFTDWLKKKWDEGELPVGLLEKLMELQSKESGLTGSSPTWIDLSTLPMPFDVATVFFSSFPEAIGSGSTNLFDNSGATIRFNWALCQALRKNRDAARPFSTD